ncbi:MAG: cyanophycinase [Myxococcota bacterium]
MPSENLPDARGPLIAIGGAEDKEREKRVLFELVRHAGGREARIAVIPTASTVPEHLAELYARVFQELGAPHPMVLQVHERKDASDPHVLEQLESATLVFFTGGDQLRLVARLGGTPLVQLVRRMNARGVPVAGTSAGAGAICQHMIGRGRSGQVLGRHMVSLAPGLGLTNRIIIDQHFSQRHRMGRLFSAVALNPFLVGVGIDEDTAACIGPDNRLTVWGRGSVTVVDGHHLSYTNVHEVEGRTSAAVLGMSVHVLTAGCAFDLTEHVAHGPSRRTE